MKTIKILVTGGGTSGHISPALAIIESIRELAARPGAGWTPEFLYVGSARGLEAELAPAAGIAFAGVATGKLRRYFSMANLTDALRVPLGVMQSLRLVRRFAPHVTLSTGGYVSVPPVLASWLLRVPCLIHEQTVQVGLANRIAARCAGRIALSFESALGELTPAARGKAFVSGNPVRKAVLRGNAAAGARWAALGEDDELPVVYVTGGSQGARVLNRAVESALPELLRLARVIHQCGRQPAGQEQDLSRLERLANDLPAQLRRRYRCIDFIREPINDVYALADLVLSRAGAGTVSELCALGKAAVYVPLVPTGGDEQTRNAAVCARAGAAVVIEQSTLDGERLLRELRPLLADRPRLLAMGSAARKLARPDAALHLAQAVLALTGHSCVT